MRMLSILSIHEDDHSQEAPEPRSEPRPEPSPKPNAYSKHTHPPLCFLPIPPLPPNQHINIRLRNHLPL